MKIITVLLDFSLTVKAGTLISFLGVVRLFPLRKGNQVLFIIWKRVYKLFEQTCVHFMKILTVYTLNSHLFTLKAHNHKMYVFVVY